MCKRGEIEEEEGGGGCIIQNRKFVFAVFYAISLYVKAATVPIDASWFGLQGLSLSVPP